MDLKEGIRIIGCGLDEYGTGQGQVLGICEHGSEPSRFIKCGVNLAGHETKRTLFFVVCLFVGWLTQL